MAEPQWETGCIRVPDSAWLTLQESVHQGASDFWDSVVRLSRLVYKQLEARSTEFQKESPELVLAEARKLAERLDVNEHYLPLVAALVEASLRQRASEADWELREEACTAVLGVRPTRSAMGYDIGDASIAFDDQEKLVFWEVHITAVSARYVHTHPIATRFFTALDLINFTDSAVVGGLVVGGWRNHPDGEGEPVFDANTLTGGQPSSPPEGTIDEDWFEVSLPSYLKRYYGNPKRNASLCQLIHDDHLGNSQFRGRPDGFTLY